MSELKPPQNWCPTCDKRPNDPEAVFCSDSFHRSSVDPVSDVLTRVSKALPVLRSMLANGKLARSDIAQEMLDDINAILATHPQPVTPAGGEVLRMEIQPEGYDYKSHTLRVHIGDQSFMVGSGPGFDSREEAEWMALFLEEAIGKLHPPVADAALVRDAERYRFLRDADNVPCSFGTMFDDETDAMMDAALNQRGGGA